MMKFDVQNECIHKLTLDKEGKPSFGICIVRGQVKDTPNTKTLGIFIKGITPNSPAELCGKLKVGDRILRINDQDVKEATEKIVIELIKCAGMRIDLEVQTFNKMDNMVDQRENGFKQNKIKINQEMNTKPANTNNMLRNSTYQQSMKNRNAIQHDDDEDDTRDMTGRILTAGGFEIDRSSAGNCRLNKQEKERDKEEEDEFGYTMAKITKRYNMIKDIRKIEFKRPPNTNIGIALAGHSDRQKMACFLAGIDPNGLLAKEDVKPGDEIIEVNGYVLKNRCHLNASVIFKNLLGEKVVIIVSRKKGNDDGMSVKPVKDFPVIVDDTKFLLEKYPKARSVLIKKEGFLGIMVIYGKHAEVGNGIFISDLREESNAVAAGVKVGDLVLAVNKDLTLDSTYDEVVALLKRAEGIVTLIIMSLKSEDTIKAEKVAEEKKKEEVKVEAEKPQDPSVAEIKPNKKIQIEIKVEKKPLGVIVVGGKNNNVKTGCVITHIYPQGAIAVDNRLKIMDHIIDVNNVPMHCSDMTTLKIHQYFCTSYDKNVSFQVYRADPIEMDKFNVEFIKKPGKELGLSIAPNNVGCTISELTPSGYSEIDNKLQRGDILTKINGESLENTTFEESFYLFKKAAGKISLEVMRPRPTCRTEQTKT